MATTSEHTDINVNKKENEEKKVDGEQDNKPSNKVDDLNQIGKTDKLSSIQSTNDDQKSDQVSSTSDNNKEKTNEETTATTTTSVTSSNANNNDEDSKKEQSSVTSNDKKKEESNDFHIEKGDAEHLTDFQREKAKYFFNVNLDIENKQYVTWDDVEFYLLFHETTSGKDASDGDLQDRLSRAARAFWENVHDQVPLPDKNRDKLTLDQFLDTWASLVDYVVAKNQLPPVVDELVKLGFELYSTDDEDGKPTIPPQAFDQLFQKMNLGRPYALMAYKYLTKKGENQLDIDKIDSLVKAVITSSDDENSSHFLLPGFFKIITLNQNKPPSPVQNKNQSKDNEEDLQESSKPSTPPPPSSSSSSQTQSTNQPSSTAQAQQQQETLSTSSSQQQQQQQKPNEPPSPPSPKVEEPKTQQQQQQQQNGPSSPSAQEKPKQPNIPLQNGPNKSFTSPPINNQQQNIPPSTIQKPTQQQEDESIRRLLRYYHIDDGDIVEVADGPVQRVVLVHPERPLPPYIQQNKQLLQKLQPNLSNASPVQQNGVNNSNNNNSSSINAETKPKVTLEERVSRGETPKGPTIPSRPDQKQPDNLSSANVRQVYPPLNESQQEEQQKQAKLQATQSKEQPSTATNDPSTSSKQTKDISRDDEEKIVAAVLKQLTPIIEKRVAAELRRIQSGDTDEDEDEDENIMPFPFMFGGGFPMFVGPRGGPQPPPPPPSSSTQGSGEQQPNISGQGQPQGPGIPPGAAFLPPQLLMAMMNDLARGEMGGDIPIFAPNMPPPSRGPAGVEGFMMFVDDDQFMGGPPGGYPTRPGPGF